MNHRFCSCKCVFCYRARAKAELARKGANVPLAMGMPRRRRAGFQDSEILEKMAKLTVKTNTASVYRGFERTLKARLPCDSRDATPLMTWAVPGSCSFCGTPENTVPQAERFNA